MFVCIVCFWIKTWSSRGINHCVSSSSNDIFVPLQVKRIGKTNRWLPKASQSWKQWFPLHVFKQPLIDLWDDLRFAKSILLPYYESMCKELNFPSRQRLDVVDQLLVCSYKCIISLSNPEFLSLDMLVVHPSICTSMLQPIDVVNGHLKTIHT